MSGFGLGEGILCSELEGAEVAEMAGIFTEAVGALPKADGTVVGPLRKRLEGPTYDGLAEERVEDDGADGAS